MAEKIEYNDSSSHNECVNNINFFNSEFAEKYEEKKWITFSEIIELSKLKEEKLQWLTEESKKYLDDEFKKIIDLQLENWIFVNDIKNIKKVSNILEKYWYIDNSNEFSEQIISYRNKSKNAWIRILKNVFNSIIFEKTKVLTDTFDIFNNNSHPLNNIWYWISPEEYQKSIKNNWLDLECK